MRTARYIECDWVSEGHLVHASDRMQQLFPGDSYINEGFDTYLCRRIQLTWTPGGPD